MSNKETLLEQSKTLHVPDTKQDLSNQTILNICLNGPYTEGFSYQDNLLPKFQRRLGYNVVVLAPAYGWSEDGIIEHFGEMDYVNKDDVRVIRMECDGHRPPSYRFKTFGDLYQVIESFSPDLIFLHGLQMRDSATVARYVECHPDTRLFVDNHADNSNSATNWISKYVLHRLIWRRYAKLLEPVTEKFWGVLPARVDFLVENYGLSREKCGLLVMGADDDEVSRASATYVREAVRYRFGFGNEDFVVVTGGKIDASKRQILLLMDAVQMMSNRVKLLMFGPVAAEMKSEFEKRLARGKMVYIPWANASESYDFFAAADVICFPGRHSVYWEQAAAMGKPLIVKRWPGTDHVDVCGNVLFLDSVSTGEISRIIATLCEDRVTLHNIQDKANLASEHFLYSSIAKRSILVDC